MAAKLKKSNEQKGLDLGVFVFFFFFRIVHIWKQKSQFLNEEMKLKLRSVLA